MITAGNRIILETFRYWFLSFFHDRITIMTSLFGSGSHKTGFPEESLSIWVPIIFSQNDLDSFHSDMARWCPKQRSYRCVVAILSPGLHLEKSLENQSGIPITTSLPTGCMADIARVLDLETGGGSSLPLPGVSEDSHRPITVREREVLDRIASGDSVKQIAFSMGISQHTVITYKRNLYMKTGARSLQQLALFAVLHPMLPSDP